jgi:hypothetical protein
MFMKIEAAPTIFLIAVLAVVMLAIQIGGGNDSVDPDQPDGPGFRLADVPFAKVLLSDSPRKDATAQVALLRTPLSGPGLPDPPQR